LLPGHQCVHLPALFLIPLGAGFNPEDILSDFPDGQVDDKNFVSRLKNVVLPAA
jgi:hypothetical protein